ncbi:MAG TPA: class E sortase [Jatrophihabitans sp.]|nr:class E sortase [Jatrophihabitans sp.]
MTELSRGGWDFSPAGAAPPGQPQLLGRAPVAGEPAGPPAAGPVPVSPGTPRRPAGRGDTVRMLLRGTGQTLITLGLVLLLFVVYEVWVSNLYADRKQHQEHQQLATAWQRGQDPLHGEDRLNLPAGKQVVLPLGDGFANLYIPAFGKDYVKTVIQGTSDGDLDRGPGHYVDTQVPGQIGNFAVAGHRVGKGEPFLNLDQLVPGDKIVVQTASNWYVYTVLGSRTAYQAARTLTGSRRDQAIAAALAAPDAQGVPGREIVSPSAIGVIAPVPDHPGATPTRAMLTLTTCHPKYTANQRMVVHAVLSRAVPVRGAALPKELAGGTL